ncbi:hypothetical protein FACS1894184_17660 [Clostridia bacterium]|nr:hypothetical protein FACS1894184_17660 [Clostridia bacterium]
MKDLIPMNSDGLFVDKGTEHVFCDSRFLAIAMNKEHGHVLRDIKNIIETPDGLSPESNQANFGLISYKDARNRKQPCYRLTKEGLSAKLDPQIQHIQIG